ncbi:unnamed protein product [Adineta ricciae]|uniref:Hexosyltransferase n=1 Tax=Adineta ricciae TaxID=249248 RepID=A0A813QBR3_ADIRI|nr:unnamed protein product [Adineta ricciae]CAF1071993.1 unnamed protein product [Adineta ricciae]
MKISILLFFCLLHLAYGKLVTKPRVCRNCTGKIHTKRELELAKLPLVIDNSQICTRGKRYQFVIIIKSGSFIKRNFTRSTWAKEMKENFNIPVLYAIGSPNNKSIQQDIVLEEQQYHDLLQFDFLDSYFNLTIKTTSVLVWYDQHCSNNSDYLFYVDDDLLISAEKFVLYMMRMNYSDTLEGWFESSGKILRTGIGGVTKENFPIDIVPDYLWGAAVLYPSNIISNKLIKAIYSTKLPIFFRDDVFINGFVADEAKIKRQQMQGLVLYDRTEDRVKDNMIVIDFTTEEHRHRAWNCLKYNEQCNQNLLLTLFKIISGCILTAIILVYCYKIFKSIELFQVLTNHSYVIFYEMKALCQDNINTIMILRRRYCPTIKCRKIKFAIYLIVHSKRTYVRLGFFLMIVLVLCYLF